MGTRNDIPTSYNECLALANGRESVNVCNNTTLEVYSDEQGSGAWILLHGHPVVKFSPNGDVVIDSCGYRTVTTKDRINRCLGDRGRVFQKDYEWFFAPGGSRSHAAPFENGMVIPPGVNGYPEHHPEVEAHLQRIRTGMARAFEKASS